MWLIIIKALPTFWPFIRELIFGKQRAGRTKKGQMDRSVIKVTIIMAAMALIIVAEADKLVELYTSRTQLINENSRLTHELEQLRDRSYGGVDYKDLREDVNQLKTNQTELSKVIDSKNQEINSLNKLNHDLSNQNKVLSGKVGKDSIAPTPSRVKLQSPTDRYNSLREDQ